MKKLVSSIIICMFLISCIIGGIVLPTYAVDPITGLDEPSQSSSLGIPSVPKQKVTKTVVIEASHNEFDWSDLWSSLLDNCSWQFEGDTGKGFVNQSQLIKVEYDYRNLSSHVSQYVNMTVKADIKDAGNYRATFKINQDAKSYIYDSKFANYTLKFDGYNVNFDWTEETKIVDAVISHSIANATKQTNRLTFSVTRNNLKANTTVNIDPTIGVDSTSSDGYAVSVAFDYATAHDATTGVVDDTDTSIVIATNKIATFYYVYRGFLFFDTSPIGTGTITESILHIFPNEIHGNGFSVQIQNGQPTYPHDPLVVGDYNKAFYSGNGGSLSVDLMNPGVSYADIILTNDGMSWINTSGITKLCLRSTNDINNIAPTGQNDSIFDSIETGSSDPYLEVTYSINAEYYVIDTTSSIYSTSYPFQRKTFYSAGLYWAFYSPGTGSNDQPINYGVSSDGLTWTIHSSEFSCYQGNGYDFSLFFNGSHVAIARVTFQTIIAPQTTPFPTLSWRLGVPQSDGSISYSAIWQTVRKGSEMDYDRFPMVIIDDNGKSFISTYNRVGGNWYGTVYHNSMTDGTWSGTTSTPYSSDGSDNSRKFSLTPINSTCIYWFRVKNGVADIYGKIWNGATWSSEENIVNDADNTLQHSSIGMDGHVEFSYTGADHIYTKTRFDNGTWQASIDNGSSNCTESQMTKLAHTTEVYHMTYFDKDTSNMTYSYYNNSWTTEIDTDIHATYCYGLTGFYENTNGMVGMMFINSTSTSVVWGMYGFSYISSYNEDSENLYAGMNCDFSAEWNTTAELSGFIFGTNNTGSWVNDTYTTTSTDWTNVTKTLNATIGKTVQWEIWGFDAVTWNNTGVQTLDTITPILDYTASPTSSGMPCVFNLTVVNIDSGMSGYIFGCNNTGEWVNESWTLFADTSPYEALVTKTLNTTPEYTIEWGFWANTTNNAWFSASDDFDSTGPEYSFFYIGVDDPNAGNWLFSEKTYYTLVTTIGVHEPYQIGCFQARFNDSAGNSVTLWYNNVTGTYGVLETDYASVAAGVTDTFSMTLVNINFLQTIWKVLLRNTLVDTFDLQCEFWANTTVGYPSGWNYSYGFLYETNLYVRGGLETGVVVTGAGGKITGGDIFDLVAYNESVVSNGEIFRNLQHIKLLPKFSFTLLSINPSRTLKYDILFKRDGDTEWLPAMRLRLSWWNSSDPLGDPQQRYTCFQVTWYQGWGNGSYHQVKVDYVYFFMADQGYADTNQTISFWVDLWFNRVNGSSVVGGRVNAYYYPMTDSSNMWSRIFWGNSWGVDESLNKESMFTTTIVDDYLGDTVYAKQIQLIQIWCEIYNGADATGNYSLQVSDYSVFDLTFAPTTFDGIPTPVFDESKIPNMQSGGFFGWIAGALMSVFSAIINMLAPAMAFLGSAAVSIIDGILQGITGQSGLFSGFLGAIGNFAAMFATMIVNSVTWITNTILVIAGTITVFFTNFFTMTWGVISTSVIFIASPAIGILYFIAGMFGISIAWLAGSTYVDGFGTVWDFTFLQGFNIFGFVGGMAIFALLALLTVIFWFGFGILGVLQTGSVDSFVSPLRLAWGFAQFMIKLLELLWVIAVHFMNLLVTTANAIRQAIPKIFGFG